MSGAKGPDLSRIRDRFIRGLPDQHEELETLLDRLMAGEGREPLVAARAILHRISGMAGTVGLGELGDAAHQCDEQMTARLEGYDEDPGIDRICETLEDYLEISVRVCIRHLHPSAAA